MGKEPDVDDPACILTTNCLALQSVLEGDLLLRFTISRYYVDRIGRDWGIIIFIKQPMIVSPLVQKLGIIFVSLTEWL